MNTSANQPLSSPSPTARRTTQPLSIMQKLFSYRGIAGLLTLASILGIAFAYFYLEKTLHLDPCPLCIFQRVGLIAMGIFAFIALLLNPKKLWLRLALMFGALLGMAWSIAVAIRHIWIQHLPADQVPSCGPGLDYWLDTLPLTRVFTEVFKGSGECAVIDWTFLGFSIPELSLAFFSVLSLLIIRAMLVTRHV